MNIDPKILRSDERAIFALRSLYRKYGYTRYKFSKFEEYDLYVRNKNFLVSDSVITFTDTDGKLMALKPDITLSIIKNAGDIPCGGVKKVYYNENVYRVSKGTKSYKEIMQAGLECMGDIDSYRIYEVMLLAAKSLEGISESFVLGIGHLGIVSSVIEDAGADRAVSAELFRCLSEKNVHEIDAICKREGIDGEKIKRLAEVYGSPDKVAPYLDEIKNEKNEKDIESLLSAVRELEDAGMAGKVQIDFSVVSDPGYYNGFVFKGYIDKISSAVLTGGQYDALMKKMGKKCGAVGFAVYLDELSELERSAEHHNSDADTVILYDEKTDEKTLCKTVEEYVTKGEAVSVVKCDDAASADVHLRCSRLVRILKKEINVSENS